MGQGETTMVQRLRPKGLRARLSARPDSEHEQAIIRVAIAAGILVYFIAVNIVVGEVTQGLVLASGFLPLSLLVFPAILANPAVSGRRPLRETLLDVGDC